jgi:endoplasmic reticulum chaperone BiP
VDAKNAFESYMYSMTTSIDDKDKLGGKLDDDDKQKIKDAVRLFPV